MTLCVLGCRTSDSPRRPVEGWHACHRCADRLAGVLDDIGTLAALLDDPEALLPTSGRMGTGGARSVPGPRSPAVDALLIHLDVRTRNGPDDYGFGALASVETWTRVVRDENHLTALIENRPSMAPPGPACGGPCSHRSCLTIRSINSGVPTGRATIARELATLRFNLHWILAQPWLDEFAAEMREVRQALEGGQAVRTVRIGPCPVVLGYVTDAGNVVDVDEEGSAVPVLCGTTLRVQLGAEVIGCRKCGSSWHRAHWRTALGDPWIDYASLEVLLGVPVGTLWRWCSEDGWRTAGTRARRLVARLDALESYARRRSGTEAG